MVTLRWTLGGMGAILLMATALALSGRNSGTISSRGIAVFQVERGNFVRTAVAEGVLRAVEATPITVPPALQGIQRIAWMAEDGASVRKGEVVVRFDTTSLERDLADGEDQLKQAELRTREAEESGESEQRNLVREATLAEREAEQAETFAPRDPGIFSRHEILDSEIDRDLARERISNARQRSDAAARKSRSQMELLRLDRSQAELRREKAKRGLAAAEITAPHAGMLVLTRGWGGEMLGPGSQVWTGMQMAELPDPGRLEVRAHVLESDATGLKSGCPASLRVEAHPGKTYPARVKQVDPLAKRREWNVPVQYFEVVLTPESGDLALMKPGLRVRADIVILENHGVLMIPPQAVFLEEGREKVYRRRGDTFVPVEVQVGERGLSRLVVLKGLGEGDEVALRDPRRGAGEILGGERPPSKKVPQASGKTP